MIEFTYIIGANIELFIIARFLPADAEVDIQSDVEIIAVRDCKGLEVETDGMVIDGEPLDNLISIAAMEAFSSGVNVIEKGNVKPSEKCKAAGLKSLAELAELSGKPTRTLTDWAANQPEFFDLVLMGAVVKRMQKVLGT